MREAERMDSNEAKALLFKLTQANIIRKDLSNKIEAFYDCNASGQYTYASIKTIFDSLATTTNSVGGGSHRHTDAFGIGRQLVNHGNETYGPRMLKNIQTTMSLVLLALETELLNS